MARPKDLKPKGQRFGEGRTPNGKAQNGRARTGSRGPQEDGESSGARKRKKRPRPGSSEDADTVEAESGDEGALLTRELGSSNLPKKVIMLTFKACVLKAGFRVQGFVVGVAAFVASMSSPWQHLPPLARTARPGTSGSQPTSSCLASHLKSCSSQLGTMCRQGMLLQSFQLNALTSGCL